jgi:hypothetical protein
MRTPILPTFGLAAVMIAGGQLALAEQPATAPSEQTATAPASPATAPASPTTAPGHSPKSSLKAYNAAMRAGDADGIVALMHAADEKEQRVAKAIARSEVYVGKMLESVRGKFGPEGAARAARAIGDVSDADIESSVETIEGDRAILRFGGEGGSATLVRVDGEWKSSTAAVLRGFNGDADAAVDQFQRRGNFAKVLAQDVAAGQVKTPDEVVARIEKHQRGASDDEPAN